MLKDIMTGDVRSINKNATLEEAALLMKEYSSDDLIVTDEGFLVGIVTDGDITKKATAMGYAPKKIRVSQVMTSDIILGYEDDSIDSAKKKMDLGGIKHIPIVDHESRLIGTVTRDDLYPKIREAKEVMDKGIDKVTAELDQNVFIDNI